MSYLVLSMCLKVVDSRIWSCGRSGLGNVDISFFYVLAILSNFVDVMDSANNNKVEFTSFPIMC